jgi:signal transduction histidine kinase/ActR/RegA family two-component response regulator
MTKPEDRASRALDLDRIFDALPGLYFAMTPELILVAASDSILRATNLVREEILGRYVFDVLPDAEPGRAAPGAMSWHASLQQVRTTKEPHAMGLTKYSVARSPADGGGFEERYWEPSNTPVLGDDGEVAYLLHHTVDVTARVRAEIREQNATEAERRRILSLLLDGPAAIGLLVGDDLVIEAANPALLEMWGRSAAVIGTPLMQALPEVVGQGFEERLHHVLHTGVAFRAEELLARLERNGRLGDAYFDLVYAPSRAPDGRITGVFVFAYEVTALVNARAEAQAANRLKDEFLATMSHELRTPLNAIVGWAALVRSNPANERMRERGLATIERSAQAQTRLIEDVLEVSRIITGKLRLDLDRVEVAAVINAALDVVRPAATAKSLELSVHIEEAIGSAFGDSDRLQQVMWNVLSNAVKFTPAGGKIEVRARRQGSALELVVQDSGIGISPEHLPHVFERFRQVDGSTTRSHGGLGLGLAIVRHLVDMHGGWVKAESPGSGMGATFTITLPIRAVHAQELETEPRPRERLTPTDGVSPRHERLGGLHILVVDDDEDSRDLVATVLENAGARVVTANGAGAAFDALGRLVPDLVISDIGMPGEDGYSFMRRLRDLPGGSGGALPAIALTAYARSEDERAVRGAGFDDHLAKPVSPAVLIETVTRLVRDART